MSLENPLVSIVIPVFNSEAFIAEAINSCINQTYRPIEIICVDNNSEDRSVSLLEQYQKLYPGIIKIHQEAEAGAPAARNRGMAVARGEFIHFLDSDDALLPNAVETLLSEMIPEVDAVSGGEAYYKDHFKGLPAYERKRINNIDYHIADILNDHPNTGALLIRNSAIKYVKWDNSLGAGQDLVFWSELVIANHARIKYIPEIVCNIRIHQSPHRISNKNKKLRAEIHYQAIIKIEELLKSSTFKSQIVEIALNDRKLKHAFNAIHARNFKVSYLTSKGVNKELIKRSSNFKWLSREGVFYFTNLYIGFLFYFLHSKVLKTLDLFQNNKTPVISRR